MQARQTLFSSLPSLLDLQTYTEFLGNCRQLIVDKISFQNAFAEPHNPPVSATDNMIHIPRSGAMQAYLRHGLHFLGLASLAASASATNSTVYPGVPAGDEPACGGNAFERCVEAYTANATQTLSRFVLITSNINNSIITETMEKVGDCFSTSEQALVAIVKNIVAYGEFYQRNKRGCIGGPHFDSNATGRFYTMGFAQDIDKNACWEFDKVVNARAIKCLTEVNCPPDVSAINIAAISLGTLLLVIGGVTTAGVFMCKYNAKKKLKDTQEQLSLPDAPVNVRDGLRQRLI